MVKLLINSLNEKQLVHELEGTEPGEKGISKLDQFLEKKGYPHRVRDVKLLRLLQAVRSAGVAHGKGRQFERISRELGLNEKPSSEVFRGLLLQANEMLAELETFFLPPVK